MHGEIKTAQPGFNPAWEDQAAITASLVSVAARRVRTNGLIGSTDAAQ
jgi:hypothetical protein